jgi:hypothetical protein
MSDPIPEGLHLICAAAVKVSQLLVKVPLIQGIYDAGNGSHGITSEYFQITFIIPSSPVFGKHEM